MQAGRRPIKRVGSYITPSEVSSQIKATGSLSVNLHDGHADKKSKATGTSPESDQEEVYQLTKHEQSLVSGIAALYKTRDLCDVILSVEKATFQAHKVVLAASSEYLREMFVMRQKVEFNENEMMKVPLLGIQANTVAAILEGMYSGSITLSKKTVDDMLSAASFLKIPCIVEACANFLSKHLTVSNCLRTLQVANLYDLKSLLEESYSLASTNFGAVCQQRELLKLRYCELRGILPRQDLNAPSEVAVFQALVRWIDADKTTRVVYAGRLMCHVRFPLIPESELVDTVESSPYVCQVPEVGELAREAVRYHLLPHRRSIMQNTRTMPRTTTNIDVIIACGGLALKREGSLTDKMFYCDVKQGLWKPFASLPEPRHHHAATTLGRFLYVAGGDSTEGCRSPSKKVWRYDTWMEEWLQVTSMETARESFQLVALEMKIYAIGGRTTQGVTVGEMEVYSPANNTWERCEPISSRRRHTAATAFDGRIYVAGGSSDDLVSRRVESYLPVNGKWERRQPLVKPRFSASLHAIDNHLWLVGGATVDATDPGLGIYGASEIELYTPGHDQWTIIKTRLNCDDAASPSLLKGSVAAWDSTTRHTASPSDENDEEFLDLCVSATRSEAGSCALHGKLYLVAGYSWLNRGRIDNVECIDTNKRKQRSPTTQEDDVTKPETSLALEPGCPDIERYPLRCTGMACVTVVLFKEPKFTPTSPVSAISPLHNDSTETVKPLSSPRTLRPVPKSASPLVQQVHASTTDQSSCGSTDSGGRPTSGVHNQAHAITRSVLNRGSSAVPRPRAGYDTLTTPDRVLQWLSTSKDVLSEIESPQEPDFHKLDSTWIPCENHKTDDNQIAFTDSQSVFLTE